uniref:Uncharacterized protein n=1 Tax=Salix viminalis TaxID=40686 RepID=A0A6N2LKY4_SALVM
MQIPGPSQYLPIKPYKMIAFPQPTRPVNSFYQESSQPQNSTTVVSDNMGRQAYVPKERSAEQHAPATTMGDGEGNTGGALESHLGIVRKTSSKWIQAHRRSADEGSTIEKLSRKLERFKIRTVQGGGVVRVEEDRSFSDMKRSRKSGRVSWAPALNLCQVRLFLSEDCPSEVGGQVLDHLQKNVLRLLPISSSKDSNDLPPGFQGTRVLNPYIKELSNIHRVQWKCPPNFVVNYDWRVTARRRKPGVRGSKTEGNEIYPRPSSVPPSPAVSLDVEEEIYDDSLTPIIPLIPVEEEEAAEMPAALTEPLKNPTTSLSQALPSALLSSGIVNSSNCNTTALNPPANQNPEPWKIN